MNRMGLKVEVLPFSVPRVSGDEPALAAPCLAGRACSPRERG